MRVSDAPLYTAITNALILAVVALACIISSSPIGLLALTLLQPIPVIVNQGALEEQEEDEPSGIGFTADI